MTKNSCIVESEAPLRSRIRLDSWTVENPLMQCSQARISREDFPARDRKRLAEPAHALGHVEIHISTRVAYHPLVASGIALQHALEIAEKLRPAVRDEVARASPCLGFLLFVIKSASDRVVSVMNFRNEVG